jgi:alkaline phosphatase
MKNITFVFLLTGAIACSPNKAEDKRQLDTQILKTIFTLPAELNNEITPDSSGAQKIILLIGDGMGVSQISSLYAFEDEEISFDRFHHIGFIKTSSYNSRITDSAAGATAFTTGIKTFNRAVGVGPDSLPVKNLNEILAEYKWKTGLVATSSITHATPAAFYAHTTSRNMEEEIARQLAYAGLDIFIGGGEAFFDKRRDKFNYLDTLIKNGYQVVTRAGKLNSQADPHTKEAFLLARKGMARWAEGRGSYLRDASLYAINKLDRTGENFMVMIEGSQIDWGGHDMDHQYLVEEMADFDETIESVLDFAEKDGNTLVIVTGDHETGGYAITGDKKEPDFVEGVFSTDYHTADLVPVFAFGPGAEKFQGIYENTEIFHKILESIREAGDGD